MPRFFKTPIHYQGTRQIFSLDGTTRTPAPEVTDNDYRTYSTELSYIIQTYGTTPTTNTTINFIWIKGTGITNYTLSVPSGMGSGAGVTTQVIQPTVTPPDGTTISTTINNIQHELLDLSSLSTDGTLNCVEAQLVFTGVNVRIYEIMLLESLLYLDSENNFTNIESTYVDNTLNQTNIRGESIRIRSLASRPKWSINYTIHFRNSSTVDYPTFSNMINNNHNFVFSQQYNRYPERVYPATWASGNFSQRYISRRISSGILVDFQIQER